MRNYIVFTSVIFYSATLIWPAQVEASAIGQLESMTGTKIDRFTPSGGAGFSTDQMAMGLAQNLVDGFISGLFNNNSNAAAAQQAELQRQIEELERVRQEELKRQRIQKAAETRALWDAESEASSRKRRSILGEPAEFDVSDIIGPDVVDLRDATTLTPKLLREPENTGQPIFQAPSGGPPTGNAQLDKLEEFKNMIAENRDPGKLNTILEDLRSDLAIETDRMRRLLKDQQFSVKEIESAEADIQQSVNNAMERGASMAFDWVFDVSKDKLSGVMSEANKAVWEGTRSMGSTQAMAITHAAGEAIGPMADTAEVLKGQEIGSRLAAAYNVAEASGVFKDVADNVLKRQQGYLKYGSSIIESAYDVTNEFMAMKQINKQVENLDRYKTAFNKMDDRMQILVEKINITKGVLKTVNPVK